MTITKLINWSYKFDDPDLVGETECGDGGRVLLHAPVLVGDDQASPVTPAT